MSALIRVLLSHQSVQLRPGEQADLIVTVQNLGEIVDRYDISVEGVDPAWVAISRRELSLFPKEQDQVRIKLLPPAGPTARTGHYDLRVHVTSQEQRTERTTAAVDLEIVIRGGLEVTLYPPLQSHLREASFSLQIGNTSNVDLTVQCSGSDLEGGCSFFFEPAQVAVPAGQERLARLTVRPRDIRPGKMGRLYPFTVTVQPQEAPELARKVQGQLQQPASRFRLWAAVGGVVLGLAAVSALLLIAWRPWGPQAMPTGTSAVAADVATPRPTATPTRISTAVSPTATPKPTMSPTRTRTTLPPTATPQPTVIPTETSTAAPPTATPVPTEGRPPGDVWTRPVDGMVMVYVPAGSYPIGSTDAEIDAAIAQCEQVHGSCPRAGWENESHRHTVILDAFWIDRTEVTNAQYGECVTAGVCDAPDITNEEWFNSPQQPVVEVDWYAAQVYCSWAGGRLPTEAEWEAAARGPQGNVYPWGDSFDVTRANSGESGDGYDTTAPVGSFPSGASWCGALDMAGNASEWVADWYGRDYYAQSPSENPQGPGSGDTRVARGGSWTHYQWGLRSADRTGWGPTDGHYSRGFRCVVPAQ